MFAALLFKLRRMNRHVPRLPQLKCLVAAGIGALPANHGVTFRQGQQTLVRQRLGGDQFEHHG